MKVKEIDLLSMWGVVAPASTVRRATPDASHPTRFFYCIHSDPFAIKPEPDPVDPITFAPAPYGTGGT